MKDNIKNILNGVVVVALASGLWSCASETPFENEEGIGSVHLHTVINNITTRAIEGYSDQELSDNCMVYISRANGDEASNGLVYRKRGLNNIESTIPLKTGHYVAEAWTGDSVAASFNKKFFRGYKSFDVENGKISQVSLNCPIQNVLVVVDASTLQSDLMNDLMYDDYTITIANKGGHVVFDKNNIESATGYFMMDASDNATLTYTFEGTRKIGNWKFKNSGEFKDVKKAFRYALKFGYDENYTDPDEDPTGATGFVTIQIDEQDASQDEASVYPSEPTITYLDKGEISETLDYSNEEFIPAELGIMICAVGDGFGEIKLECSESAGSISYDYLNETDIAESKKNGIEFIESGYNEQTNTTTAFILFKKSIFITKYINGEYRFIINVKDKSGKGNQKTLTIRR